jgi:hypothetical protein
LSTSNFHAIGGNIGVVKLIYRSLTGEGKSSKSIIFLVILLTISILLAYHILIQQKFRDEAAGGRQVLLNYPLNTTRSFTLHADRGPVYFEFIGLEVLRDMDSMLFMPYEVPANAAVRFENLPYIAPIKFSIRAKCPEDPSSCFIGDVYIEWYDGEERVWKRLLGFGIPRHVKEVPSFLSPYLTVQDGDRYDIYFGTNYPPLKIPLWFDGIDRNVRLHTILRFISDSSGNYYTGKILYQAGNMTVVYERGFKPFGRDYYVNYLHVYIEPFELPYVKFKVEDVKFLSSTELSSKVELTLRNVGSLPLVGRLLHDGREADFDFTPDDMPITILTVNEKAFTVHHDFSGILMYPIWGSCIINLPKPWEREGWAVIIFPNETVKAIVYAEIRENQVVVRGQEGEIALHAKPVIQHLNIDANPFEYSLYLEKIVVEVRNDGNSPFFAEKERIDVSVDGRRIPLDMVWGVIPPGEVGKVELRLETGENIINYKELVREITIKVSVDGGEATYSMPPLVPKLEVVDVIYDGAIMEEKYCKGLIINIENNWIFPVEPEWLETYINGKILGYFYPFPKPYEIKPGESRKLTVDFVEKIKLGSIIEIRFGATTLKVKINH